MSHAEIIAQLPNLKAEERSQVFQQLCELQEDDLLRGVGATEAEKGCWTKPFAITKRDGNGGEPWCEVLRQVRAVSKP